MPTRGADACVDERAQRAQALPRRRGARLGRPPDVVVEGRDRERRRETSARRAASASTSASRTISGPRVMIENGCRGVAQHLDAGPRQPVAPLGRLVRVGGGADRDRLAPRAGAGELAPQHLRDVHLDPDRRAVAVVGRPVGALLERPDVTERAAVDAAHVRD